MKEKYLRLVAIFLRVIVCSGDQKSGDWQNSVGKSTLRTKYNPRVEAQSDQVRNGRKGKLGDSAIVTISGTNRKGCYVTFVGVKVYE